ncbi:MAG: hypothetical protein QX191_09525, partial [Methylococcaceae bacterium]
ACASRQGLNEQSCIVSELCLSAPEQPCMCSDIAFNAEGMGMVQVAEIVKEIQLTSSTQTNARRQGRFLLKYNAVITRPRGWKSVYR